MSFPQFPGRIQNTSTDGQIQITFHQVHENHQVQITAKTETVGLSSFFGMSKLFQPENSVGIKINDQSLFVNVTDLAKELNVSEASIHEAEKNGTLDKFLTLALKAKHFGVTVPVFNETELQVRETIKKIEALHAKDGLVTTNSSGATRPITEQELQKIKSTVRNAFHSLELVADHDLTFHFGKKLGAGDNASVIQRVDLLRGTLLTGDESVLKVPKSSDRDSKQINNEVNILNKVHAKGLVIGMQKQLRLVKDMFAKRKAPDGHLGAYYEGSLQDISKLSNKLDFFEKRNFAYQLAEGLNHLHSIGITHGDIKPENIFFNSGHREEDGIAKAYLGDFGGAVDHTLSEILPQINVSMLYRPMDDNIASQKAFREGNVQLYKEIEESCDVYAMASVICELFTGEIPYNGSPSDDRTYQIKPELVDELEKTGLSLKTIDLLTQSLNLSYESRPKIIDLLAALSKELSV